MLNDLFEAEYDGPFFTCGETALSYREFYSAAHSLAAALSCGGPSPVVIRCGTSPLAAVCIAACLLCGRPYVPVSLSLPPVRFEHIWRVCGAGLLLAPETERPSAFDPTLTWYAGRIRALCGMGAAFEAEPQDPLSPAAYFFTSGSGGVPKGVCVLRENLEHFTEWFTSQPWFAARQPRVILGQAPFFFDLSDAHFFPALFWGARLVIPEAADFASLFETFRQSGAELAVWTPSFAALCLCDPSFDEAMLPALRYFWFCGERLQPALVQKLRARFPHTAVINAYGPTEAACAVASVEITQEVLENAGPSLPVGRVSGAAAGLSVSDEHELYLSGKSVCGGYEGPSPAFSFKDGVRRYATGDLAHIAGGFLYLDGRRDGQFKYAGCRIEAGDIEQTLCTHCGAAAAAAVPVENSRGETEKIVVFAVSALSPRQLRDRAAAVLPAYMVPHIFKIVPSLPLTENGKLDRNALREEAARLCSL